jgi:transposase-like protein
MPKRINSALKSKIALEALQGQRTVAEIASQYGVHPNFVTRLKTETIKKMATLFEQGEDKRVKELEKERDDLLNIIGEKELDIKWLKKKCRQLGLL